MSKTPRTDDLFKSYEADRGGMAHIVLRRGVEQLETELADKDRQLAEVLGEIKGLRQLVNDCHIIAGQLETERNEARAEIERLKEKIKRCSTCKHYLPDNEMIEVCLNEAHCCRTTAWRVIDRTTSAQRENWPDLWEEDR